MKLIKSAILGFLVGLLFTNVFAGDIELTWKPVTPAELAMKTPSVEPNADAEAIFWDVWLDNKKSNKLSYNHYVRVKIFTERGREKFSKFDIPFFKGRKVENVAARVIKPDGTTIELQPADIFEREIVRAGKLKIRAKSFAVPGIEPGVIVEYRYTEILKNDSLNGESLVYQRDIPMQRVSYYIRPFKGTSLGFSYRNMPEMRFSQNSDGFYVGTLTNVPALKDEPRMPPEDEVRYWVSLSYKTFGSIFNWALIGYGMGSYLKDATKPSKEIKQKAAELTAGVSTPEEKLRKIYEFSQKKVKNIVYDSAFTNEQREKLKIKDAADVLKRGMGSSEDIDFLFAALAKAGGFNVALVYSGDRSENFFDPGKYNGLSYVHPMGIAVLIDHKWKYFNPGTPFMPFGRVDWYEENVQAIVAEEDGYTWKSVPLSAYSESPARRKGDFQLLEDGTLEGLVRLEYEGHQAVSRRRDGFKDSPNKREEDIKEEFKAKMKTVEISDVTIENFDDPEKPLIYSFKVSVPNYAQKTGKRLFVQPGFFEYGSSPLFSSVERKHEIYFAYPWQEIDNIEIKYPEGFELDSADSPADVADPSKIGSLKIDIGVNKETRTLNYRRNFYFGNNGKILFPVAVYKPMKNLFDLFHKADTHIVTLKQN